MDGDHGHLDTARTALLDRLLDEAAQIGEAARTHIGELEADTSPLGKLHAQHEVGVIATCLGFSVAWLIEQKAIAAGEVDSPTPTPVGDHAATPPADPVEVGRDLAALGQRARAFGMRIQRLAAH